MATQPIVVRFAPVERYLSTSYSPDCEYDEDTVVERNLGEIEHAFLQAILSTSAALHKGGHERRICSLP